MISDYFEAPSALERMRSGTVGPHVDGFATALAESGYSPHTIRDYVRTAAHLGRWAEGCDIALAEFDDDVLGPFRRHLSRCRCFKRSKGVFKGAATAAEQLLAYLRRCGAIAAKPAAPIAAAGGMSVRFATWMLRHRGVAPSTMSRYQLALRPFLTELVRSRRRTTLVASGRSSSSSLAPAGVEIVGLPSAPSAPSSVSSWPMVVSPRGLSKAFRRCPSGASLRFHGTWRRRPSSASSPRAT